MSDERYRWEIETVRLRWEIQIGDGDERWRWEIEMGD